MISPLQRIFFSSPSFQRDYARKPPPPFFNVISLLNAFECKNLGHTDLVALSGAHTLGITHPPLPRSRSRHGRSLRGPSTRHVPHTRHPATAPSTTSERPICSMPATSSTSSTGRGLFTSDQVLFNDARTRPIVKRLVAKPELFFERFAEAMVKMGQLDVRRGNGEVRKDSGRPWGRSIGRPPQAQSRLCIDIPIRCKDDFLILYKKNIK
ncbi:peroxidase 12-like [Elaeis guineensis]|uniref:peroxidase 12-like n=1 Tax=Elaeis guineensis var. tenera TaxID=51953 RepID=UPI003C6CF8B1